MRSTQLLLQRTPLIKFLGKRTIPKVDHTPKPHSQAPDGLMPQGGSSPLSSSIRRDPGVGRVQHGTFALNSDLPLRFQYTVLSEAELENINSGGAHVVF